MAHSKDRWKRSGITLLVGVGLALGLFLLSGGLGSEPSDGDEPTTTTPSETPGNESSAGLARTRQFRVVRHDLERANWRIVNEAPPVRHSSDPVETNHWGGMDIGVSRR